MKLNLGCGVNHLAGWTNVDSAPASKPDIVWDLERTPWPWPDRSIEEMMFNHSLEHMGQESRVFLAIMQEMYRVAQPGAVIRINVPHPRHDNFLNDPTHVRPVTPAMLMMFDRTKNEGYARAGASNTPLGLYLGVDFEVFDVYAALEEPYAAQMKAGKLAGRGRRPRSGAQQRHLGIPDSDARAQSSSRLTSRRTATSFRPNGPGRR